MGKRKRIPEEARRRQILEAAFAVPYQEGIRGLTVRAVASEAGISHTLGLFHFERKANLVLELLDWVLDTTSVLHISADVARFPHARDQFHALLEQEVTRQSHQPDNARLFLEYWALGELDPGSAVQALVAPDQFDTDDYLAAMRGVFARARPEN